MFKRILLMLTLAAAVRSQPNNGWTTGPEYYPWDVVPSVYCAWSQVYLYGTWQKTPIVGMGVIPTASAQTSSGWHSHASVRPYPPLISITPSGGSTDTNGCVYLKWKGPGYSGWYTFSITPNSIFALSRGSNDYLAYRDTTYGPTSPLTNFLPSPYATTATYHSDSRHQSATGAIGNQRYGTITSIYAMQQLTYGFWNKTGPPNGPSNFILDLARGSLPDGGIADNEFALPGIGYVSGEWSARPMEEHALGQEWDIVNPGPAMMDSDYYLLLEGAAQIYGCTPGIMDPNGNVIIPLGIAGYWVTQPVVHLSCGQSTRVQ